MASKNQQLIANRLAKRNAAAAKKAKNVGEASWKESQYGEEPKAKRPKMDAVPEKKAPQLKLKGSTSTVPPSGDKEKGKKVIGADLPTSETTEEEVRHHLAVQGLRIFGGKTEQEMTEYLNTMTDWCIGGAMLAQFFVGAMRDLAALPTLKKNFHHVTAKLEVDELKLHIALGGVFSRRHQADEVPESRGGVEDPGPILEADEEEEGGPDNENVADEDGGPNDEVIVVEDDGPNKDGTSDEEKAPPQAEGE
ncbi:hypothetical protein SESBI_16284 [Sesbania bispinosa]|nr:hypothetical protein SESBI_16284 [Sesbania bispinosa]